MVDIERRKMRKCPACVTDVKLSVMTFHLRWMQGSETKWRQLRQSQQQPESLYESEGGGDTDVPASQLADKDSLFVQCNGLSIHYKQAYPAQVSKTSMASKLLLAAVIYTTKKPRCLCLKTCFTWMHLK